MWVSVYACVRVFTLCFIPMAQSHHLRACVSIEFIFGLDMNNKLVIINFVCYTVLSRLNLMWKCGNSRTHISYSHTTRHPHVLTLTLSLSLSASRFHFPSTFSDARWERLFDNLYTFVVFSLFFHCVYEISRTHECYSSLLFHLTAIGKTKRKKYIRRKN